MASIQPELWVERAASAVVFYQAAFGAAVLLQVGAGEDIVAQLAVDGAVFWVGTAGTIAGRRTPKSAGGTTSRTLLVVEDPDEVMDRACRAGATQTSSVGEEHGWRLGRLIDPFGHEWELGRPSNSGPAG